MPRCNSIVFTQLIMLIVAPVPNSETHQALLPKVHRDVVIQVRRVRSHLEDSGLDPKGD